MTYGEALRTPGTKLYEAAKAQERLDARLAAMSEEERAEAFAAMMHPDTWREYLAN